MNWSLLRMAPWLDTRARFLAAIPQAGKMLDVGSSDGETLGHFAEMRPDLQFMATDIAGSPEKYPQGCDFHRGDLNQDPLPWCDGSLDAVTCMHLIEHLEDLEPLLRETARLLKPGGRVYFETPHPKTLSLPSESGAAVGQFTMNFYDDRTHTRPVTMGSLAQQLRPLGFEVLNSGTSRNWMFAASYPLLKFTPPSRQRSTARVHWLGWSAYLIAKRLPEVPDSA